MLCFNRIQADFNGKFGAVFAQPEEISSCTHRPGVRTGHELLAVFRVLSAEPFRHEHLDALSDQLSPAITERLFYLSVDQQNFADVIDHDDPIWGGLNNQAEALLCALAFRDVYNGAEN